MNEGMNLADDREVPAGTSIDPIAFGPLRLFIDGDQLVVGRRQGRNWDYQAFPRADTELAARVDGQDGDERRWAVELRDRDGVHPSVHLFFYRELEPYGLPGGLAAWAQRLELPLVVPEHP